jgi:hypothetical protein
MRTFSKPVWGVLRVFTCLLGSLMWFCVGRASAAVAPGAGGQSCQTSYGQSGLGPTNRSHWNGSLRCHFLQHRCAHAGRTIGPLVRLKRRTHSPLNPQNRIQLLAVYRPTRRCANGRPPTSRMSRSILRCSIGETSLMELRLTFGLPSSEWAGVDAAEPTTSRV